jgi:hypothetical protein
VTTDDDLLRALDQLTNTIYWCRQRGIPATAGSAILEAVGDWLDSQDPTRDDNVPSVTAAAALDADPLAVAFDRLGRHVRTKSSDGTPQSVTAALTEALDHWTAAVAAEHHRSTPFGSSTVRPP